MQGWLQSQMNHGLTQLHLSKNNSRCPQRAPCFAMYKTFSVTLHILTLRLCRNISPIPGSLIAMHQWATSHSITGTESVSSAPRRSLCFPVPPGSRCSCPSIREDSRNGETSATTSSWSGTLWPEPSDQNAHHSTHPATSAATTCLCPHTTASPV